MEIVKQFKSKKNNVFLVKNDGHFKILKKFSSIKGYNKEKNFYKILQGENLNIPSILEENILEKSIVYEYIGDRNGVDLIEKYEKDNNEKECLKFLIKIYEWLKDFHSAPYIKENNLCFFDLSFRNFLLYRDKIYGIDLESITEGKLSLDVGRMLAMYLYYDEVKSDFKMKVFKKTKEHILKDGKVRPEDLQYAIRIEEEMIKIRRDRR
jgi:tRNA A-37 threonylcarbamoyl transferase component Bud32